MLPFFVQDIGICTQKYCCTDIQQLSGLATWGVLNLNEPLFSVRWGCPESLLRSKLSQVLSLGITPTGSYISIMHGMRAP